MTQSFSPSPSPAPSPERRRRLPRPDRGAARFPRRPDRRSAAVRIACPTPTRRGSICDAPPPPSQPRVTSGPPILALRPQMRISAAIAISMPPPRTQPFNAAITGFLISRTSAAYSMRSRKAMRSDRSTSVLRSLPAEKARSPAPPIVTTRMLRSTSMARQMRCNSRVISGVMAFILSARSIRICPIPSSMVSATRPVMAIPLPRLSRRGAARASLDFLEDAGDIKAGAELVDHVAEHRRPGNPAT